MATILTYFTAAFSAMAAFAWVAHLAGHGEYIFHAGFLGLVIIAIVGVAHFANVMGKRSEVIDKNFEKLDGLDKKVTGMDERLTRMWYVLMRLVSLVDEDNKLDLHTHLQKSSPLNLTEYGKDIAKNINADTLVKAYADKIQIPDDFNAYEIQKECFRYANEDLMDEVTEKEKDIIQINAYKSGDPVLFALEVMGVLFRDYWLEKKGIDADDVDKLDPEAE